MYLHWLRILVLDLTIFNMAATSKYFERASLTMRYVSRLVSSSG